MHQMRRTFSLLSGKMNESGGRGRGRGEVRAMEDGIFAAILNDFSGL